jgi:hypothetical protein
LALADSLARSGRAEEARHVLMAWWDRERSEAPRGQLEHAIWLRGVLTVDPEQAALEYRRLVVEFPGGRYAARSLARLARVAAASGDTLEAVRAWEALLREHPGSPDRVDARVWLRRHGQPDSSDGPEGTASPGVADGPEATAGMPPGRVGDHAVQLGAFDSDTRARELLEQARAAGLEARLVRVSGSQLIRVRSGRFRTEVEARARRGRIVRLGFEALVVDDAAREVPLGGR